MPLPHKIQMVLIRERLKGKEGKSKVEEIEKIQSELPGFNTGPYGEIKKWLRHELEKTRIRSKVRHQDWLGVKKEGVKQFVLVGPPNVGKSSLINKLSGLQTKIANYQFTTLKPIPGMININGADIQIIDLPGFIEGASEDAGGGRRLLGIVKSADGIILMHDLTQPFAEFEKVRLELTKQNISKPTVVLGNKIDIMEEKLSELQLHLPQNRVIGISALTGEGLQELKNTLWKMSGLIRIYPKNQPNPLIMSSGSTIEDYAAKIHKDLIRDFRFARVTGKSSRFPNQQFGLNHVLDDGDVIEIVVKR